MGSSISLPLDSKELNQALIHSQNILSRTGCCGHYFIISGKKVSFKSITTVFIEACKNGTFRPTNELVDRLKVLNGLGEVQINKRNGFIALILRIFHWIAALFSNGYRQFNSEAAIATIATYVPPSIEPPPPPLTPLPGPEVELPPSPIPQLPIPEAINVSVTPHAIPDIAIPPPPPSPPTPTAPTEVIASHSDAPPANPAPLTPPRPASPLPLPAPTTVVLKSSITQDELENLYREPEIDLSLYQFPITITARDGSSKKISGIELIASFPSGTRYIFPVATEENRKMLHELLIDCTERVDSRKTKIRLSNIQCAIPILDCFNWKSTRALFEYWQLTSEQYDQLFTHNLQPHLIQPIKQGGNNQESQVVNNLDRIALTNPAKYAKRLIANFHLLKNPEGSFYEGWETVLQGLRGRTINNGGTLTESFFLPFLEMLFETNDKNFIAVCREIVHKELIPENLYAPFIVKVLTKKREDKPFIHELIRQLLAVSHREIWFNSNHIFKTDHEFQQFLSATLDPQFIVPHISSPKSTTAIFLKILQQPCLTPARIRILLTHCFPEKTTLLEMIDSARDLCGGVDDPVTKRFVHTCVLKVQDFFCLESFNTPEFSNFIKDICIAPPPKHSEFNPFFQLAFLCCGEQASTILETAVGFAAKQSNYFDRCKIEMNVRVFLSALFYEEAKAWDLTPRHIDKIKAILRYYWPNRASLFDIEFQEIRNEQLLEVSFLYLLDLTDSKEDLSHILPIKVNNLLNTKWNPSDKISRYFKRLVEIVKRNPKAFLKLAGPHLNDIWEDDAPDIFYRSLLIKHRPYLASVVRQCLEPIRNEIVQPVPLPTVLEDMVLSYDHDSSVELLEQMAPETIATMSEQDILKILIPIRDFLKITPLK